MSDGPPPLEQFDARRRLSSILFRTLHITWGNQEPFQSQALARAGRSERAVPLVRYFPNGVRSRLPVLLLRLPSRLTLTTIGTIDEPVFKAPAALGVPSASRPRRASS